MKYTIVNPYEGVDWKNCKTFLANLHTHTSASDGEPTLTEMVRAYYDAGYDILAITDHGVINRGWTKARKTYPLFNKFRKVFPMSAEDYKNMTAGVGRAGRGMTDITGGIECNFAVVSKVHVNGYWTEYGSGVWGKENDYKTAAVEIDKAGGYSVLNHVGDWVDSHHYPERAHDDFYIGYFADIFVSAPTCLGMEIINNSDRVTREDRALWDELLQVVIPAGRNIWGFADDDSEKLNEVGRSFELFPLTENTEENVKQAMISGAFFAASKFDKTVRGGETEGNGAVPVVNEIIVSNENGTITVIPAQTRDCKRIEWISDGKIIADTFTLDLNKTSEKPGCYVRFKLYGDGGVTYSQPFELRYEGRKEKPIPVLPVPQGLKGKLSEAKRHSHFVALGGFIRELIKRKQNEKRAAKQ